MPELPTSIGRVGLAAAGSGPPSTRTSPSRPRPRPRRRRLATARRVARTSCAVGQARRSGTAPRPGPPAAGPDGRWTCRRGPGAGPATPPAGAAGRRTRLTGRGGAPSSGSPRTCRAARTRSVAAGVDHEHQHAPVALGAVGDLEVVDVDAHLPEQGGHLGQDTRAGPDTGTRTSAVVLAGGDPGRQVDPGLPGPLEHFEQHLAVAVRRRSGAPRRAPSAAGRGRRGSRPGSRRRRRARWPDRRPRSVVMSRKPPGRQAEQGGVLEGGVGGQVHQGGGGQVGDVRDQGHQVVVAGGGQLDDVRPQGADDGAHGGERHRVGVRPSG